MLRATPNGAGRPSTVSLSASGFAASGLPQGITLAIYKGFKLDLAAVAQRCTSASACPPASRIASGTFGATGTFAGFSQPVTGTISAFLGNASRGALADVIVNISAAGVSATATGQLVATPAAPTYGYELRFDPLPAMMLPPGVTVTINQLALTVGASSNVSVAKPKPKHRRRRKHHKRRKHRRAHRALAAHNLITNPARCAAPWPVELRLRYVDHTDTRAAAISCSG